jgi:hypothetical protein
MVGGMSLLPAAGADFEVTGPDGRRILLKDDNTWRYVGTKDKEPAQEKPKEKPKDEGEMILRVERKTEFGSSCRYDLRLVNNLPYEIRSIVPAFWAYRPNGVVYDRVLSAFQSIKPGDSQSQEIHFHGITCQNIARVQVLGGDRCVMGDLDRFSEAKGECLSKIRVVASDLVRFEKEVKKDDKELKGDKEVKGNK